MSTRYKRRLEPIEDEDTQFPLLTPFSPPPLCFRVALRPPYHYLRDDFVPDKDSVLILIEGSYDHALTQTSFVILASRCAVREPGYTPFSNPLVTPRLYFHNAFDLTALHVSGGARYSRTRFAKRLSELSRSECCANHLCLSSDTKSVQADQQTFSRTGCACVATTLPPNGPNTTTEDEREHMLRASQVSSCGHPGLRKRRRLKFYDTPVDPMFCATSLIIEVKTEHLFATLCDLIGRLIQAYQVSACRLGLMLYQSHFTRLYCANEGKILYEVRDPALWGTSSSIIDVKLRFGGRNEYCAHVLGTRRTEFTRLEYDPDSLVILTQTLRAGVRHLAFLPFQGVSFEDLDDPQYVEAAAGIETDALPCHPPNPGEHENRPNHSLPIETAARHQASGGMTGRQASHDTKAANGVSNLSTSSWGTTPTSHDSPLTFTGVSTNEAKQGPEEIAPEDSISVRSSASESDEEDSEVWWDPETDIDNTPAGLNPVYRVLDEAGVMVEFVSPETMDRLVAAWGRPPRLGRQD